MNKPMEYPWIIVRVYGGNVSGFRARKIGEISAPSWIEAMQRAKEEFGVSYGGLTAIPAN